MITALRSAYNPYVNTPPAGKFNTGQKINSLLVLVYVIAFVVSGSLMWIYNTMLFPWFFHASVFFMAVASLGGHLYLSFLHPSTRPGLIGIFNGMVPKSYIEHHHSLTLRSAAHDAHEEQDTTEQRDRRSGARSGYRVFMTAEIVILILVLIGGGFGVKASAKAQRLNLKRGFNSFVNPNELSNAHRIKEIDECVKCHEYSGELPDRKCLSCHKIIQARMEARLGNHGDIKNKCIHCHKEHPGASGSIINFDTKKFDHAVAAFKLEGKHKDVKCENCHKRKISGDGNNPAGYYVGLRHDECLDCHKNIHKVSLGEKCETCHSPAGWQGKNLKFDHTSAKFHLEGKHTLVKCEKCHKPQTADAALGTAVFKGLNFGRCDDCHKDPHRGQLRAGCASCHSVQGWRGKELKFDHGRDAKFALEGKHTEVKCVKCHRSKPENGLLDETSFRKKHDLCSDCHKDPHRGELTAKCSACHVTRGWQGKELKFNHDRNSEYILEGKHRELRCAQCHKPKSEGAPLATAQFKLKHEVCSDCHKNPHKKWKFSRGTTCADCHMYVSWKKKKE